MKSVPGGVVAALSGLFAFDNSGRRLPSFAAIFRLLFD